MSTIWSVRGWLEIPAEAKEGVTNEIERLINIRDVFNEDDPIDYWNKTIDPQCWIFMPEDYSTSPHLVFVVEVVREIFPDFERQLRALLSLSLHLSGFFYVTNDEGEVWWYQVSNDELKMSTKPFLYSWYDEWDDSPLDPEDIA